MKKLKVLILLTIIFSSASFGTSYSGYKYEVFFGSMGSARSEAMGRIISVDKNAFSYISNPAMIADQRGLHISYSNSNFRDQSFDNNHFNFSGVKYNYKDNYFGINLLYINKETARITGQDNPNYKIISLTYARPISNILNFGARVNMFVDDIYKNNRKSGTFLDLGLYKSKEFLRTNRLNDNLYFGLQYSNFLNQSIDFDNTTLLFPSILRVGFNYDLYYINDYNFYSSPYLIKLSPAIEYQNVTNSEYFKGMRYGLELGLFDILFARCGYYSIKQEEHSHTQYPDQYSRYLSEATYGFGIKFELNRYLENFIPLNINIDYTELNNPNEYKPVDFGNFSIIDLTVNYKMK